MFFVNTLMNAILISRSGASSYHAIPEISLATETQWKSTLRGKIPKWRQPGNSRTRLQFSPPQGSKFILHLKKWWSEIPVPVETEGRYPVYRKDRPPAKKCGYAYDGQRCRGSTDKHWVLRHVMSEAGILLKRSNRHVGVILNTPAKRQIAQAAMPTCPCCLQKFTRKEFLKDHLETEKHAEGQQDEVKRLFDDFEAKERGGPYGRFDVNVEKVLLELETAGAGSSGGSSG
jgi:hypothetical protein